MKLLVQNQKIKNSSTSKALVYNFGIPALKSADGTFTCPNASKCVIGCYAKSGAYLFSNVARAYEERYQLSLTDDFSALISAELSKIVQSRKALSKAVFVRIHDSGDFYSKAYFEKWRSVMTAFPSVHFYAYTKIVSQFKALDLPDNFTVIFSLGGKQDSLIDQKNDRHSKVFESESALKKAGYTDCSHDDLKAIKAKKVGLVYHGAKNYENTAWNKI